MLIKVKATFYEDTHLKMPKHIATPQSSTGNFRHFSSVKLKRKKKKIVIRPNQGLAETEQLRTFLVL